MRSHRVSRGQGISIHALREEGDPHRHRRHRGRVHFYPRPPRGGRQVCPSSKRLMRSFLSTPSARRATCPRRCPRWRRGYFYPRPPRGGRPVRVSFPFGQENFYPRPPRGGRRMRRNSTPRPSRFLSTPSARRATSVTPGSSSSTALFLSTPSARRATAAAIHGRGLAGDFYPRPPRGGRLYHKHTSWSRGVISIHALREEGDSRTSGRAAACYSFLSTPSARRATS